MIALAIIVILGYVMVLVSAAMPKFKLMQKLVDNINLVSREILTGLSVIRAFGREKKEEERFDDANRSLTKTTLFTNRIIYDAWYDADHECAYNKHCMGRCTQN